MVRADTLLSFLHTKVNIPLFYSCVNTFLSFISHTECSYYTRTSMTADNRSNIMDKYFKALISGSVDPESTIEQAEAEMEAAGLADIIAEKQAQLDAYLAEQQ